MVDRLEPVAVERAKRLFQVEHANVQPYSGSPANLAIYIAFCEPGDTVMGMALPMGGHLTHGWGVSVKGKWFNPVRVLNGWTRTQFRFASAPRSVARTFGPEP